MANIERGKTSYKFIELLGRRFYNQSITLEMDEKEIMNKIISELPSQAEMADAMVKLTVIYPRDLDSSIDEIYLRGYCENAFEFHLLRRPQNQLRGRLPTDSSISSMLPLDLIKKYWETIGLDGNSVIELNDLAAQIINQAETGLES